MPEASPRSEARSTRWLWLLPLLILVAENVAVVQLRHPWFMLPLYKYRGGIPIVFALALLLFARSRVRAPQFADLSFRRNFGIVHVAALGLFALVEAFLLRFHSGLREPMLGVVILVWLLLILALVVSACLAFIPLRRGTRLIRAIGSAWGYAAGCAVLVMATRAAMRVAWGNPASRLGTLLQNITFRETRAVLELFYPTVISVPSVHALGTDRFVVLIEGACSGVEGLALIAGLLLVWFVFARDDLRFPRAFLLLPVALCLMWQFNILRLVALIAIGSAGHPAVAIKGFHTQAGWIAFNAVGLGLLFVAHKAPWFRKGIDVVIPAGGTFQAFQADRVRVGRNVPAIYLGPFLAITAASLVSQAVSGNFEWLYPLRFVAGIGALWAFRNEYRRMDWRFGALGPIAGLLVGMVWIGAHDALVGSTSIGASMTMLSAGGRISWIVVRVLAAVVTVPIAEELAFRGFLARGLVSARVEDVPFSGLTAVSILGSSVVFGALHGRMWVAGIGAGIVFAAVAKVRGRLGEAVAAHMSANLVIAVVALARGDYGLW